MWPVPSPRPLPRSGVAAPKVELVAPGGNHFFRNEPEQSQTPGDVVPGVGFASLHPCFELPAHPLNEGRFSEGPGEPPYPRQVLAVFRLRLDHHPSEGEPASSQMFEKALSQGAGGEGGDVDPLRRRVELGGLGQLRWRRGQDAGTVVAINSDREAPIFETADYCIVDDVFQVLAPLIDALEREKAGKKG